ncbi:MAG: DUF4258 domain-containing protein [Chitinophagales bacterium]|nr:DUF4258 domain-containing protein [Chitinophagales bacterium]
MAANKKRGTAIGSILLILGLLLVVGIKKCYFSSPTAGFDTNLNENEVRVKLISHKMTYTAHAKCRMKCRDIDAGEILDVLEKGVLNKEKSAPNGDNCPTFAFEGKSADGQNLRVIFAGCDKTTRVVTCIDLGVEHECNCR